MYPFRLYDNGVIAKISSAEKLCIFSKPVRGSGSDCQEKRDTVSDLNFILSLSLIIVLMIEPNWTLRGKTDLDTKIINGNAN